MMSRFAHALVATPALLALTSAPGQVETTELVTALEPADGFGQSVAIDGNFAVVGVRTADAAGQEDSGRAVVFERRVDGWHQCAVLTATPEPQALAEFGVAVAIEDDLIAVSARLHDRDDCRDTPDCGQNAGRVYLFDLIDNSPRWAPAGFLEAPSPRAFEEFGFSLAIEQSRIVVGTRREVPNTGRGVYVFDQGEDPVLIEGDPSVPDGFGASVALQGSHVFIGAPRNGDGTVHVFMEMKAHEWKETQCITPTLTSGLDVGRFGNAIAVLGDRMLIGARFTDQVSPSTVDDTGAAFLAAHSPSQWTITHRLLADKPMAGHRFGTDVAIASYGTARRLFVGVPGTAGAGSFSGRVDVFELAHPEFALEIAVDLLPAESLLGQSVNADCIRVIGGAPNADGQQGRAYAFELQQCEGDLDDDQQVGFQDLLLLLLAWGTTPGDVNCDGATDFADLLQILSSWGPCE